MDIYHRIINNDPQINWAMYKYTTNLLGDLKVYKYGLSSLSNIEDYWDDTDLIQAIVRVDVDKITRHIILVTFCGEGASQIKKAQTFIKYHDIEKIFRGFKIHIQARNAACVKYAILKAINVSEEKLLSHFIKSHSLSTSTNLDEGHKVITEILNNPKIPLPLPLLPFKAEPPLVQSDTPSLPYNNNSHTDQLQNSYSPLFITNGCKSPSYDYKSPHTSSIVPESPPHMSHLQNFSNDASAIVAKTHHNPFVQDSELDCDYQQKGIKEILFIFEQKNSNVSDSSLLKSKNYSHHFPITHSLPHQPHPPLDHSPSKPSSPKSTPFKNSTSAITSNLNLSSPSTLSLTVHKLSNDSDFLLTRSPSNYKSPIASPPPIPSYANFAPKNSSQKIPPTPKTPLPPKLHPVPISRIAPKLNVAPKSNAAPRSNISPKSSVAPRSPVASKSPVAPKLPVAPKSPVLLQSPVASQSPSKTDLHISHSIKNKINIFLPDNRCDGDIVTYHTNKDTVGPDLLQHRAPQIIPSLNTIENDSLRHDQLPLESRTRKFYNDNKIDTIDNKFVIEYKISNDTNSFSTNPRSSNNIDNDQVKAGLSPLLNNYNDEKLIDSMINIFLNRDTPKLSICVPSTLDLYTHDDTYLNSTEQQPSPDKFRTSKKSSKSGYSKPQSKNGPFSKIKSIFEITKSFSHHSDSNKHKSTKKGENTSINSQHFVSKVELIETPDQAFGSQESLPGKIITLNSMEYPSDENLADCPKDDRSIIDVTQNLCNQNKYDYNQKSPFSTSTSAHESNECPSINSNHSAPRIIKYRARVLYDYFNSKDNELSIYRDQIIEDVVKLADEWWYGTVDGENGLFPASYVEII